MKNLTKFFILILLGVGIMTSCTKDEDLQPVPVNTPVFKKTVLQVPTVYPTIQEAVNAAVNGDEIQIEAGTYTEQVVIENKDLKIKGKDGASIQAPFFPVLYQTYGTESLRGIILIKGGNVKIEKLTIDGVNRGKQIQTLCGVIFANADGEVKNCTIRDIRNLTLNSSYQGRAVYIENSLAEMKKVSVKDNDIFGFQYIGVEAFGDPTIEDVPAYSNLEVSVNNNNITGLGQISQLPQSGVYLHHGVTGEIKNNRISNIHYENGNIYGAGVFTKFCYYMDIKDNRLTDCVPGFYIAACESPKIENNKLELTVVPSTAQPLTGIYLSGLNIKLNENDLTNYYTGLWVGSSVYGLAMNVKVDHTTFITITEPIKYNDISQPAVDEKHSRYR